MKELWKPINGYEGLYQVSNLGRIKSLKRFAKTKGGGLRTVHCKILKFGMHDYRYRNVTLHKDGVQKSFTVHRLVATHFLNKSNSNDVVNHINGIKTDNRANNLEWCTQKHNSVHAVKLGLQKGIKGVENPLSKPVIQKTLDGDVIKVYGCINDAAKENGINQGNISNCASGRCSTVGGFRWEYA